MLCSRLARCRKAVDRVLSRVTAVPIRSSRDRSRASCVVDLLVPDCVRAVRLRVVPVVPCNGLSIALGRFRVLVIVRLVVLVVRLVVCVFRVVRLPTARVAVTFRRSRDRFRWVRSSFMPIRLPLLRSRLDRLLSRASRLLRSRPAAPVRLCWAPSLLARLATRTRVLLSRWQVLAPVRLSPPRVVLMRARWCLPRCPARIAVLTWLVILWISALQLLLNVLLLAELSMARSTVAQTLFAMLLSGVKNAQLDVSEPWNVPVLSHLLGPSRLPGLTIALATASLAGKSGVDRDVLVRLLVGLALPVLSLVELALEMADAVALALIGAMASELLIVTLSLVRNPPAIVILLVPSGTWLLRRHGRLRLPMLTLPTAMAPLAFPMLVLMSRSCLGRMILILWIRPRVVMLLLARLQADSIRTLRNCRVLQNWPVVWNAL